MSIAAREEGGFFNVEGGEGWPGSEGEERGKGMMRRKKHKKKLTAYSG